MPSQTSKGYPYPVGTDRVMDGDNAIQALAEFADARVGVWAAGSVVINVSSLNTSFPVAVTFPASRFSAAPFLATASGISSATVAGPVTATSITTTGFQIATCRLSGGTGNATVYWLAVQI